MLKAVLDEGMKLKIGGKKSNRNKNNKNAVGGASGGDTAGGKYVELEEQTPHGDAEAGRSNNDLISSVEDEAPLIKTNDGESQPQPTTTEKGKLSVS